MRRENVPIYFNTEFALKASYSGHTFPTSMALWGRKRVSVNILNLFETYMIQCPLWGF